MFLLVGCALHTVRDTALSERNEPEEPIDPAEPLEGVLSVIPATPQLSFKAGIAELVAQKTIMKFVGKGNNDELFFSRIILVENYKNGKKHGKWIYYNGDASIDKIEEYRDGELVE